MVEQLHRLFMENLKILDVSYTRYFYADINHNKNFIDE